MSLCFMVFAGFSQKADTPVMWLSFDEINVNKDRWLSELPGANIQLINTRSSFKPFTIINPDDEPEWDFYSGEFHRNIRQLILPLLFLIGIKQS